MIVGGAALFFIPGMISAFFGFYIGRSISIGLEMLSYLSIPLLIIGVFVFLVGRAKKRKLVQEGTVNGAMMSMQRSRKSLIVWNILAVILTLPVTFTTVLVGTMASDSGTSSAYTAGYIIMGFGVFYFLFVLFSIYMSHKKRSLKWAIWPMVFPAILIVISMLAPLILLPLLYSASAS